MGADSPVEYGIFKTEIKNRFLCTVDIAGTETICYIPSSCRLSNFIDLTGRRVMLRPIGKKDARTKYSVYAVRYRGCYVLLNLSDSSRIIEESLGRRMFSFLGPRKEALRERTVDGYKSDLYLVDTDTVVEVKSILSFDKIARFPTVFSERANRQLRELKGLLKSGHRVCYMLISMYCGVKQICINEEQEEYCRLLRECVKDGMTVRAFSLAIKKERPFVKAPVDVRL